MLQLEQLLRVGYLFQVNVCCYSHAHKPPLSTLVVQESKETIMYSTLKLGALFPAMVLGKVFCGNTSKLRPSETRPNTTAFSQRQLVKCCLMHQVNTTGML